MENKEELVFYKLCSLKLNAPIAK